MHDQKSVKCMNCVSVKSQALFPNYYYYYLHFFFRAKTITYDFFHRKLEVNIILSVFVGLKLKTEDIRVTGASCHMGKCPKGFISVTVRF